MRNHSLALKTKYHYHVFVHLWWSLKFHFKKISAMTKLGKFLELGSLGLGEIFFTTPFLPVALTREALPPSPPLHTPQPRLYLGSHCNPFSKALGSFC